MIYVRKKLILDTRFFSTSYSYTMTRPSTLYHLLRNVKPRSLDKGSTSLPPPRPNPLDHWCHIGFKQQPSFQLERIQPQPQPYSHDDTLEITMYEDSKTLH